MAMQATRDCVGKLVATEKPLEGVALDLVAGLPPLRDQVRVESVVARMRRRLEDPRQQPPEERCPHSFHPKIVLSASLTEKTVRPDWDT